MSWFDGIRHRLSVLLDPTSHARDVEDEMRMHMELDAMHAGDLRHAALRFGSRTYYREEVRRMTWPGRLDSIRQDARYAWRSLTRTPSFTIMAVATLALGIGVTASAFGQIDKIFLRPPSGLGNADELRVVYAQHFRTGDGKPFFSSNLNYPLFREVAAALGDTSRIAVYSTDNSLRMQKRPDAPRLRGVYASANYASVLGLSLERGRWFAPHEDRLGAEIPLAVLSHRYWLHQFNGDEQVLGKSVEIEGVRHTIIGVLDESFNGLSAQASDVWMPLAAMPTPSWMDGNWWETPNMYSLRSVYRATGEADAGFSQRATARVQAFARADPKGHGDTLMTIQAGPIIEALGPAKHGSEIVIATRLAGVAVLVMIIACANVINLLLARAVRRRHEFAVRLALGISRARLMRLLTTETILLALIAAIPALLATWWGSAALRSLLAPEVEFYDSALTMRVVMFTLAVSVIAGAVAGIVPALQASKPDLTSSLKASARLGSAQRSRLRSALIVTQAALSVVLLAGSALFVRSLHNVQSLDIGFDANRLVFGYVQFADGDERASTAQNATLGDIARRLESRPGIVSVAGASMEPMQGFSMMQFFTTNDSLQTFRQNAPTVSRVSAKFFETAGIRIESGHTFSGSGAPAEVIVNRALADRLWPGKEAVGQCMRLESSDRPCMIVVGVTENSRRGSVIEEETAYIYYIPMSEKSGRPTLVVRTSGDPNLAMAEVRAALKEAHPTGFPVVRTMLENLEPEYRPWRLGAALFTSFGVLALAVALVGIYSTVSYGVSQRTHEFGIRIALGARTANVLRQVLADGLRTVVIGSLAGVVLVLAGGKLITSMLYGVSPNDVATLVIVCLLLVTAAALASLVPAWRAARVDPVIALRSE